jgi:hypothetical protein
MSLPPDLVLRLDISIFKGITTTVYKSAPEQEGRTLLGPLVLNAAEKLADNYGLQYYDDLMIEVVMTPALLLDCKVLRDGTAVGDTSTESPFNEHQSRVCQRAEHFSKLEYGSD